MTLSEYYKSIDVPLSERIKTEKNILLVVPKKEYDIAAVLKRMGISRYEVAVTYPKPGVDLLAEVCVARPLVTVQIDMRFSRKWPLISSDGDWDASFEQTLKDAVADRFVALHHHDEFSIKDGLGTIEQLIKILKSQRRSYCCVTNHGSVGGWIRQYNACRSAGIKPIFGMEAYVKRDRIKERSANHLIMLANNEQGFYNIIQIHNDAQINGFYYDPRANWECIEKWGSGIVGTSACFAGEISRFLMNEELTEGERFVRSKEVYDFYTKSFDQFYIELQIIEFEEQRELNRRLVNFCRRVDGEFILACDSHYLEAEQADTHDLLMMARQGKTVLDKMSDKADVWNFEVRNLYYRSAEQMETTYKVGFDEQQLIPDEDGIMERQTVRKPGFIDDVFTEEVFDEAMANTHKVARDCEDIILDDTAKLPKLYDDSPEMLREKVNVGFKERGLHKMKNKQEYVDRLLHEFDIVKKLGWPDYFLVMDYIIRWTIENYGEWSVGYGRGSAAGSLISYCLDLTDIDPIEHGLLFERFLDESRSDPPDIDTDFDPRVRPFVKEHIIERFGKDYTCSIGTYQTYKTKAVIIDVARTLGLDVHEANQVTKQMDSLQSFENDEGQEEKVDKMSFDDLEEHYPELKEYFDRYPEVKIHAKVLRNQVKNMGKHAGGVIISDLNLKGRIPVQLDKDDNIISSWAESGNASELSKVGLVKYDILGLNNLPVIGDCVKLVEEHRGIVIKRSEIPINDRESIRMGAKRDLVGIFQFENPATREIVDAVEMENLNDVSAITSLLRPGPKDLGMHEEYARRKHGAKYDMPDFMREALKETFGVITYQEQCMNISKLLSGFTGPEANKLRKAIGKKLLDLMAEMKIKFINGAQVRVKAGEITSEEVDEVWEQLEAFAGYGFNKSVDKDTKVVTLDGIRRIEDVRAGQKVWCFDGNGFVATDVVALHDHGVLPAFEIVFNDGSKEVCTLNHKFLTRHGQVSIRNIIEFDYGVYADAESERKLDLSDLSRCVPDQENFGGSFEGVKTRQQRQAKGYQLCGLRCEDAYEGVRETSGKVSRSYCHSESKQGNGECKEREGEDRNSGVGARNTEIKENVSNSRQFSNSESGSLCDDDFLEQERSRTKGGIRDCSDNFSPTRNKKAEGYSTEEVADGEPRSICGDYQKGSKGSEAIQGRRLVGGQRVEWIGIQEERTGSLWGDKEAVRLCQEGLLDRSGRVLALRDGLHEQALLVSKCSREGYYSQQGSREARDSVSAVGSRLLEGIRKGYPQERLESSLGATSGEPSSGSISVRKVLHARFVGTRQMYDLEVSHPSHNFRLASGLITSNSHAVAYSAITTVQLWLKYHYPIEYITALANNTAQGKKKTSIGVSNLLVHYLNYGRKRGFDVLKPCVNKSGTVFNIEDKNIRFSLTHIKKVASNAEHILSLAPYESMKDFYDKCVYQTTTKTGANAGKLRTTRPNKGVVESLIAAGAFDHLPPMDLWPSGEDDIDIPLRRNTVLAEYYAAKKGKKEESPEYSAKQWREKEVEAMGLCLSEPPLVQQWDELITKRKWATIDESADKTRVIMFGQIMNIRAHTSKKGNNMHIVTFSDGIDTIDFFVFDGGRQLFLDTYKTGNICAIPLKKFDEGETRFFDEYREGQIVVP